MKVTHGANTVIVEMDALVAEQLLEVLGKVEDNSDFFRGGLAELAALLEGVAEIRTPSPLYVAEIVPNSYTGSPFVNLRATTDLEMSERGY